MPTAAVRDGDLSVATLPIYDPLTGAANGSGRTAFAGNQIPAGSHRRHRDESCSVLLPLPNLRNPDGTIPETNNYFVAGAVRPQPAHPRHQGELERDDQKLNFFGRFSVLDFFTENGTNFGKELQGAPLGSSNPGSGEGNTYNFSVGSTYTLSSTLVMDAHVGFVRMNTGVAQSDLDENKGLNLLGLPGTNGPNFYEGGTPLFDLDTYADLGTTDTFMPYYRNDDQYPDGVQHQLDRRRATTSGSAPTSTTRRSTTRSRKSAAATALARAAASGSRPGRRSSRVARRQPVQRLRLVPARRPEPDRPAQAGRAVHDAQLAVQPLRPRPVAAHLEADGVVRHPLGVLSRCRPRANRGLERYNVDTNQMMIGGVGAVPEDLGVEVSKTMFAPRVGIVFRVHARRWCSAPDSASPTIRIRSRGRCAPTIRPS